MIRPLAGILLAAAIVGCRASQAVRDPEYAALAAAAVQAQQVPDPVGAAVNRRIPELEGPHPVEDYLGFALLQNPEVQAARKRLEAAANRVPVAASLQDPMLGVTALPQPVQTAAGPQEVLLYANQKLPWFGKLSRRAEMAEQEAQMARARLAAVELATAEKVKRAYYELYFIQQAIGITEVDRDSLVRLRDIALKRLEAGTVNQQDVLRADVEVSNVENQLIRLRQQLESAQARLATVLHVSPSTQLRAVDRLSTEWIPEDVERLYRQAVAARPELHAQLAAIERDRRAADVARLDYYPDVTLGLTWIDVSRAGLSPIANGRDSLLLGASVNLPVYRRRLDAALRAAEANAVASARQYDSLRDETQGEVLDLFAQVRSQQELLDLFRLDILPKARQTLDVSTRAYAVGDVDFLQLIDNWRELLRYEIMYQQLEAQLRQSLASLERVVGGFQQSAAGPEVLPPPEGRQPVPPVPPQQGGPPMPPAPPAPPPDR